MIGLVIPGLASLGGLSGLLAEDVKPDGGSPTIVPIVLVGALVVAIGIWMIVAVFVQRGPSPEETALAYEWAWDRLDFPMLWDLSAPTMREGRTRDEFVADKTAAYGDRGQEYTGLVDQVIVESIESGRLQAVVRTRLFLAGHPAHDPDVGDRPHELGNELYLKRDGGTWRVAAYRLDRRARQPIA
jgi:hypothetical protein